MKEKREKMVGLIRNKYGLDSSNVLSIMLQIPRHKFVSKENKDFAYRDAPVSIGFGQTMSQPYTVAVMTDLIIGNREQGVGYKKKGKVLEIGTGSGYQAVVLSKLFRKVYTVEIIPELAKCARSTLVRMGYKNVHVKTGSGEWGWEENAPYDAIMITAGVEKVPDELFEQLKAGGILIAPVGEGKDKVMVRIVKFKGIEAKDLKNPTSLKLRGAWEEFGTFHFVPFIQEKD